MGNKRSALRKIEKAKAADGGMVNIAVTMQDVQILIRENPLFASQLQNVVLQRIVREQQAELDKLRNGKKLEGVADAAPGKN